MRKNWKFRKEQFSGHSYDFCHSCIISCESVMHSMANYSCFKDLVVIFCFKHFFKVGNAWILKKVDILLIIMSLKKHVYRNRRMIPKILPFCIFQKIQLRNRLCFRHHKKYFGLKIDLISSQLKLQVKFCVIVVFFARDNTSSPSL